MKSFAIRVGKGRSGLSIDAAKLVEGRCLVQGASGSGKSYFARIVAEQTIPGGLQTIILDSEGEFLSLRENCDLLIAGTEGDVPCEVRSAKLLARRIAETGVSAVVDLSGLKLDDRRQFIKAFLETLDGLPKKLERPRLIVLDEAHKYCPEAGKGKAVSTDAVVTLMSQGRKRGLAGMLLTQRLSKVKKDAAAEAANVVIGKTSPIDLGSAQDLLGVTKQVREELRSLRPGTFYATGPALSSDDVELFEARRATTSHPEPGARYKMSTPPPQRAIKRILKEFEALPPSKEQEEAQSVADAKKRIRELERELRQASTGAPGPDMTVVRGLEDQVRELRNLLDASHAQLRRSEKYREALRRDVTKHLGKLELELAAAKELISVERTPLELGSQAPAVFNRQAAPRGTRPAPRVRHQESAPKAPSPPPNGALGRGARDRVLQVLLQHPDGITPAKTRYLAKISPKSSTLSVALSDLRRDGLEAKARNGLLQATSLAFETYGDQVEPLPSGEDLRRYWLGVVGENSATGRVLTLLYQSYPETLSHDDLREGAQISPSSSTLSVALAELRKLQLITKGRDVKANDHLFE